MKLITLLSTNHGMIYRTNIRKCGALFKRHEYKTKTDNSDKQEQQHYEDLTSSSTEATKNKINNNPNPHSEKLFPNIQHYNLDFLRDFHWTYLQIVTTFLLPPTLSLKKISRIYGSWFPLPILNHL
ncbi:hypothetical protein RCL_jg27135.t1 [Rhizophagus clarus]|uniref:Uncharacterized protein n=1 Tax=Rhizophagus clarus TaxID=94130 RepID=A0A8H3MEF5_9GLOM|nr:hypothetical protein RCL_jg27135.t1 [Rhizophagus clarus]